LVVFDEFN